ncbi:MAG: hypothetical protein FJZ87_10930 [Chloroflexi bacterium]|nr:hypothetical protein [Chloroflexota bacterium]
MVEAVISWLVVILIWFAAIFLLSGRDWRVQLAVMAFQYLAAFWLITRHLPFAMASAKLVAGWMVVASLGMTRISLIQVDEQASFRAQDRFFPLTLAGVVAVVTAGASPRIEAVIPGIGLPVIAGSLLLVGTGLMQLGITSNILRIILGLLSLLMGFEIIYSAVESSILVAGLLAVTNLALGLVGSYLLMAEATPSSELEEDLLT